MSTPTPEMLAAVQTFATYYGRTWKQELNGRWENGWRTGDSDWFNTAHLQQLRNQFGPRWLTSYRLPRKTHT